jgi:hypothetical protein
MDDTGHWECSIINESTEVPFGFIYLITNKTTNKKYIGKKECLTVKKRAPLKGKKNKRHETVETDWKVYTSSSRQLNEDIEEQGKDNFTFEILMFCDSKWQLAYEETKIQFEKEVILRDDYYNGIINCRIGRRKQTAIRPKA